MNNKKGVSEVVSYVLLIVIAIGISTMVFSFLYLYVPKEKPECKDGINLVVENIVCVNNGTDNILNFTLENRGLFKVEMAYVRIGLTGREFREDVPSTNPLPLFNTLSTPDLNPDEETTILSFTLPKAYSSIGNYILEIQPAHFTKKRDIESLALCPTIEQQANCASEGAPQNTYLVSVHRSNSGINTGSMTSTPSGINCVQPCYDCSSVPGCSAYFPDASSLTITAAEPEFSSWTFSNDCDNTDNNQCIISNLDSPVSATASFN